MCTERPPIYAPETNAPAEFSMRVPHFARSSRGSGPLAVAGLLFAAWITAHLRDLSWPEHSLTISRSVELKFGFGSQGLEIDDPAPMTGAEVARQWEGHARAFVLHESRSKRVTQRIRYSVSAAHGSGRALASGGYEAIADALAARLQLQDVNWNPPDRIVGADKPSAGFFVNGDGFGPLHGSVSNPYYGRWILTAFARALQVCAAGLIVVWVWKREQRRRRSMRGQCCECGYMLRGKLRCPECGSQSARDPRSKFSYADNT